MRRYKTPLASVITSPARLGHISDETQLVLDRFGFEPPLRIQTMRTPGAATSITTRRPRWAAP